MADEEAVVERESAEAKRARQDKETSEARVARQTRLGHIEAKPKARSKKKAETEVESE